MTRELSTNNAVTYLFVIYLNGRVFSSDKCLLYSIDTVFSLHKINILLCTLRFPFSHIGRRNESQGLNLTSLDDVTKETSSFMNPNTVRLTPLLSQGTKQKPRGPSMVSS